MKGVITSPIASLIFRRFAQDYDLFIDNCQLFSQLLAETIGGRENAEQVRKILSEKSMMNLPIAASWLAGPVYHLTAVVHHALPIDELVQNLEKFYYHPRLYGSREKTKENIEAMFEKINPFS